jgi:integrase
MTRTGVRGYSLLFWTGMRHGEAAALRWNDIDLKRGMISISRSRDEGEDNATKRAASSREIPMLPWVVDLLKRLPRRLHFDGSEFVFLSPEGKPMTDTWWPKRGAARRPVDDESKGIWFRCLRSLGIRPRKFYMTRHTFIAWALSEGANLKGLAEYVERPCR